MTEPRPEYPGPERPAPPASPAPVPQPVSEAEAPPPPPPVAPVTRHLARFRIVLGGLIGVAIGAIGATLVLVAGQGPGRSNDRWSAWKPSSTSLTDGAQQIADHVAPTYRQPGGDQLVGVTGGPLKVQAAPDPLPARIAVADTGAQKIGIVRGKAALYTLCGLGPRCAINRGKPSVQRFLLLRREALELALYSFHYLDGVDNVVALMPPAPGQKPQNAVFFQRGEFKKVLDRPLPAILPSPPPSLTTLAASPQGRVISTVTAPSVYCYSFQQAQDLSAFLVLQRPDPTAKQPCASALGTGSGSAGGGAGGSSASGGSSGATGATGSGNG